MWGLPNRISGEQTIPDRHAYNVIIFSCDSDLLSNKGAIGKSQIKLLIKGRFQNGKLL